MSSNHKIHELTTTNALVNVDTEQFLRDLMKKSYSEPGFIYNEQVKAVLAEIRQSDPERFEHFRAALKKTEVRVTELDKQLAPYVGDDEKRPSVTDQLLECADGAEFFHDTDQTAYADIEFDGARKTYSVRSKSFKLWLTKQYFEETGGAPPSEALNAVINTLEAKALFGGKELPVFLRVAEMEGIIYIDLCNDAAQVIAVSADEWSVIINPPVRFKRTSGMMPLPVPKAGGSIDLLRKHVRVACEDHFVLIVSWLLASMRPKGPYSIVVMSGEHGAAKTTTCRLVRSVVDPNLSPVRALPKNDQDLIIAAFNSHIIASDNISTLADWLSDGFCRMATGSGYSTRSLYTNDDEVIFQCQKPCIVNGIEDFITRPDFIDRSLFIQLEVIPDGERRTEEAVDASFAADHPHILGALLDMMVHGLRTLPEIHLDALPRMADFAFWASACEGAVWPAGTFMKAYQSNQVEVLQRSVEDEPIAQAVMKMMEKETAWSGTITELKQVLASYRDEGQVTTSRQWPTANNAFSGRLRRFIPALRKMGVMFDFHKSGDRIVTISRKPDDVAESSPISSESPEFIFGDDEVVDWGEFARLGGVGGLGDQLRA